MNFKVKLFVNVQVAYWIADLETAKAQTTSADCVERGLVFRVW